MSDKGFYATEGAGGLTALHLGPMTVTWHSLDGRVALDVRAGTKKVEVYASKTGRSLRIFRDGEELT